MRPLVAGRRRVALVRSGPTAWADEGRFVGSNDLDLTALGLSIAEDTAQQLRLLSPTKIVTSDSRRALTTTAALERSTGLTADRDARLRSPNALAWEGLTCRQISSLYPSQSFAWATSTLDVGQASAVESRKDVCVRATASLTETLEQGSPDELLIVVTHDLTARVLISTMLNLPDSMWSTFGEMDHCSWSLLAEERRSWRLTHHNIRPVSLKTDPNAHDRPS